ncbi:MAG: hypothetical protein R3C42_06290 [Parvularculaceae bacterium]
MLKAAAGMLGVGLDDLVRRDATPRPAGLDDNRRLHGGHGRDDRAVGFVVTRAMRLSAGVARRRPINARQLRDR